MNYFKYYSIIAILFLMVVACDNEGSQNQASLGGSTDSGAAVTPVEYSFTRAEASPYLELWLDSAEVKTDLPKIKEDNFEQDLYAFYSERDFAPAWNQTAANQLLQAIQQLDREGLNPASFPLDTLQQLHQAAINSTDAERGARLDLLLSASYLKLADMLATGKVKPGRFYDSWYIKPTVPDTLYTNLQQALSSTNLAASLDRFRPRYEQYQMLQEQLERYTTIVESGGWPSIDTEQEIVPGDSSEQIITLRKRLYTTGDLQTPPAQWTTPAVYDSTLIPAVKAYQARHGLETQATVNADMIEALNVPAEMRLKQIMLNLDRIRWFATGEMPSTYVLVNIPEYELHVVENGTEIKQMKVVVGERMNSTPIFSDMIEYTIFAPYWNVPTSIAMAEIWPAARRNPGYLASRHFEVLTGWGDGARVISPSQVDWGNLRSYRIRQTPGPWNALGRVKFIFPNDFAIYLHDTPADHLFERNQRDFSHGCIRVADPAWFADWLFPQFTLQEVKQKMNSTDRDVVSLENELPVFIFYLTSFVDEEGNMNFREDLYELDKKLTKQFDMI